MWSTRARLAAAYAGLPSPRSCLFRAVYLARGRPISARSRAVSAADSCGEPDGRAALGERHHRARQPKEARDSSKDISGRLRGARAGLADPGAKPRVLSRLVRDPLLSSFACAICVADSDDLNQSPESPPGKRLHGSPAAGDRNALVAREDAHVQAELGPGVIAFSDERRVSAPQLRAGTCSCSRRSSSCPSRGTCCLKHLPGRPAHQRGGPTPRRSLHRRVPTTRPTNSEPLAEPESHDRPLRLRSGAAPFFTAGRDHELQHADGLRAESARLPRGRPEDEQSSRAMQ